MADISNATYWSEIDATNDQSPPNGAPEGWSPASVNDWGRATMGAVKRSWDRSNPTVTSTGSAGAFVYTPSNASYPVAYVQGETYSFKANFTAVGGDTLNVNSLGALGIYKSTPSGMVAVVAGDIQTNAMVECVYDSALNGGLGGFQLVNSAAGAASFIPPGSMMMYAATAAPSGWLLCNGSAVSRTTYATLFSAISTTYGTGDGSTTFNVPDCRGRFMAGYDPSNASGRLTAASSGGASASALANAGGEQSHTLVTGELAAHSHGVSDPGHGHGFNDPGHGHGVSDPQHIHGVGDPGHGHGVNDPGHAHTYDQTQGGGGTVIYQAGPSLLQFPGEPTSTSTTSISIQGSGTGVYLGYALTGIGIQGAGTGASVAAAGTGISTQNAGSSTGHNTVPPALIVNYIIKT
jgi:microcystin-dependent protein